MNFNKIKKLLQGGPESIIRKALTRSTTLELSEDQTKVKRKDDAPIKTQDEIDEATLYVEQIPINSTHESISSVFSRFGKVNYVSLPRYKKSRQIKQFGFVEFDDLESLDAAINAFKKVDGLLQYSHLKAENLLSITTHEKDDTEVVPKEKEVEAVPDEKESDEPPVKKARLEDEEPQQIPDSTEPCVDAEMPDEVPIKENSPDTSTDVVDAESKTEEPETADGAPKKKKNRCHKKKNNKKAFFDESLLAMKIMRKREWKKLRNGYLNLERQKAKEIKKILRESYNKRHNIKMREIQKFSPVNTASPRINFYGSPNDREDQTEAVFEPESSQASGLTFIPGVIVNIKFREPSLDLKEIKKEFKQYPYVAYVDVLESGAECYIRTETPSSAQELVNQYSSCEYETGVLKDDAEKKYWESIFNKRDAKKNKSQPRKEQPAVKRLRGRQKLVDKINKASQHIRFEETTEDTVE